MRKTTKREERAAPQAKNDPASTFKRQWRTLQALAAEKKGLTLKELSERFGTSEKTARRDLETLADVFDGIEARAEDRGRKRYRFKGGEFSFLLGLTCDELLALYVGQNLTAPLQGTIFADELASAMRKIKSALPESRVEHAERIAPLFFRFETSRPIYGDVARSVVDAALTALEESRKLRVWYRSLKSSETQEYSICPYSFVCYRGAIYLIGHSCKDEAVRCWKMSRMSDAEALREKFERPSDFDAEAFLANTFALFVGETETTRVKTRFFGSAARIVREERLNGWISTTPEDGGTTLVELETEYGTAFARWTLGYGAGAETLEPPEARAAVLAELDAVARRYGATVRPLETEETAKKTETIISKPF
ncbi:MAG: WYL domain-containing protein [Thermoguttaceae bacterium]|nr:WYL domain-containing protein [Thermoguttaceae bacterium]